MTVDTGSTSEWLKIAPFLPFQMNYATKATRPITLDASLRLELLSLTFEVQIRIYSCTLSTINFSLYREHSFPNNLPHMLVRFERGFRFINTRTWFREGNSITRFHCVRTLRLESCSAKWVYQNKEEKAELLWKWPWFLLLKESLHLFHVPGSQSRLDDIWNCRDFTIQWFCWREFKPM